MSTLHTIQRALLVLSLGLGLSQGLGITSAAARGPRARQGEARQAVDGQSDTYRREASMFDPVSAPAPDARPITFNGRPATPRDLQILARFEAAWGAPLPAGAYWYDNMSGAAGVWGGPTRGVLGPGLGLGGTQVPANASGGGSGALTGVFINGRELHPMDVQGLTMMMGRPPALGRWWVDGAGNFGLEGYGAMGNLYAIAAQRQGGRGGTYWRPNNGKGGSTYVGAGCASVTQRFSPSDPNSTYTSYVGCE